MHPLFPWEEDGGGGGRGEGGAGAHYECVNTWMIFEWTYDLILVISSWEWFYLIKADRTTQLRFYGMADGFTSTASLKTHTLNRWQTCYLNWKFKTFCIWNNLVYVCIVHHSTKAFVRQELFVYQGIFVRIILLKKLRKSNS